MGGRITVQAGNSTSAVTTAVIELYVLPPFLFHYAFLLNGYLAPVLTHTQQTCFDDAD